MSVPVMPPGCARADKVMARASHQLFRGGSWRIRVENRVGKGSLKVVGDGSW